MCTQFRCTALRIKKALGIFREQITTRTRTTRVAFWDPPSGSKNYQIIRQGPDYKKILRLSYDVIITYDNRKSNLR